MDLCETRTHDHAFRGHLLYQLNLAQTNLFCSLLCLDIQACLKNLKTKRILPSKSKKTKTKQSYYVNKFIKINELKLKL